VPKHWDDGAPCEVIRAKNPDEACLKAAAT